VITAILHFSGNKLIYFCVINDVIDHWLSGVILTCPGSLIALSFFKNLFDSNS